MKTLLPITAMILAFAFYLSTFPQDLHAQELPEPVGYLNDFASVFAPDIAVGLEDSLRLAEEETGAEIVIVTVIDLDGTTIEDYAVRLFEEWQIGKRGEDNGVLLIMSMTEQAVRIEVGYGLESVITDGRAGRILDEAVLPEFNSGNYGLGLLQGAYEIRLSMEEAGVKPSNAVSGANSNSSTGTIEFFSDRAWLLIAIAGVGAYAFGYMARTRSIWAGTIWGGIAGWMVGWLGFSVIGGLYGIVPGVILGLILDVILSAAYRGQAVSGSSRSWHRTWGGFGGVRMGWRSGGGFGGFGGGRSGGGGASRGF